MADSESCLTQDTPITDEDLPCDRHELFGVACRGLELRHWTPIPSRSVTPRAMSCQARCRSTSPVAGFESVQSHFPAASVGSTAPKAPHSARMSKSHASALRASGELFKVIVQVPGPCGASRVGLLVAPTTRVGPRPRKPDILTEFWGERSVQLGPLTGRIVQGERVPQNRRLTKVRGLLAERWKPPPGSEQDHDNAFDAPALSLKELVEAATGVPIKQQKLSFGLRGPLNNDDLAVAECDIRDGSVINLSVKPSSSKKVPPRRGGWRAAQVDAGKSPGGTQLSVQQSLGEASMCQKSSASSSFPPKIWQITSARPNWTTSIKPSKIGDSAVASPRFATQLAVNSWNSTSVQAAKSVLWRSLESPGACR
eukprot:gb/GFBE01032408.1/.p1 GENE.gb/GFBE01032408.1/~~gb/GFBE01032408.1/.p1  ORF type:complete len:369 (+),score=58.31 gb/GFBE01032408.1/:1-1107(+)